VALWGFLDRSGADMSDPLAPDPIRNPMADPLVELPDVSPTSDLVDIDATPSGAVTVTLNRPARKNALDADLISALDEAFKDLAGAEGVRVVFLRAAGATFSAGADPEWLRNAAESSEAANREDAFALARMLKQLWDLPALTVALVEGPALDGGLGLVAACDLAVATPQATFGALDVRRGLVPAEIGPYVAAAVGERAARGLLAAGRVVDAETALRVGLLSELASDAAALDAVRARIARDILACAPGAIAGTKRLASEVFGREIDHGLAEETARRAAAARTAEEGREGVAALLQGRRPGWTEAGD
jgi:methylglutaconyl-CoA hydratase